MKDEEKLKVEGQKESQVVCGTDKSRVDWVEAPQKKSTA